MSKTLPRDTCRATTDRTADGPANDAPPRGRVSLEWVLVDGALHHVSAFASLLPRDRPAAQCPLCERGVHLKLGSVVRHHAAHRRGDACEVTKPETALHFNLKCHLAAQLEAGVRRPVPLRVRESCAGGYWELSEEDSTDAAASNVASSPAWVAGLLACTEHRERVWLQQWDRVALERQIGGTRIPDVVLYLDERPVAAIEVFHTHAVDAAKAQALAELGVPWVEVRADEALLVGETAWTLAAALPVHRQGPAARWWCGDHERARQKALTEAARAREAARRATVVGAAKVVDFFYPSGKHWRHVYRVDELRRDGVPYAVALARVDAVVCELPLSSAPRAELWRRLKAACDEDVVRLATARGAHTDSPMDWAKGPLAARPVERATTLWFRRCPLEATHPMRYRWVPARREWFVPRDLRDVIWDRPPNDPLTVRHAAFGRRPPPQAARAAANHAGLDRFTAALPRQANIPAYQHQGPVPIEAFGTTVAEVIDLPWGRVLALAVPASAPSRAVIIPSIAIERAAALDFARWLDGQGVEARWVSRQEHRPHGLTELPWAPLVRAADGGYAVPIDGFAVPLAEAVEGFALEE